MVKVLWKVSGIALNSPAPSLITLFEAKQHFSATSLRVSATCSLIFVKIKFLDTSIKQPRRELPANHARREKPLWQGGVRGECHQLSQRTQRVRGWITGKECSKGREKCKPRRNCAPVLASRALQGNWELILGTAKAPQSLLNQSWPQLQEMLSAVCDWMS